MKTPKCSHMTTRGNLDVVGITLAGGEAQACRQNATQRIVTDVRVMFRCAKHEMVATETARTYQIEAK